MANMEELVVADLVMADQVIKAPKEKRILKLKSSDGVIFDVDEEVACLTYFAKHLIEDVGDNAFESPIPVPKVASNILRKVIEYCTYHVEIDQKNNSEDLPAIPKEEIAAWDAEFMKIDQKTLFDLIMAADYMIIESLLMLATKTVADNMIKGKTIHEIRETFNIPNEFSPDEEEEYRRETDWAFD